MECQSFPILLPFVAYLSMPNVWNASQCCRQSLRCWFSWIRQLDRKRPKFRWDKQMYCKKSCEQNFFFGDSVQRPYLIAFYLQIEWIEEEDDIFSDVVRQWDLRKFIIYHRGTFKAGCRSGNCNYDICKIFLTNTSWLHLLTALVYCSLWSNVDVVCGYTWESGPYEWQVSSSNLNLAVAMVQSSNSGRITSSIVDIIVLKCEYFSMRDNVRWDNKISSFCT